MFDLHTHICPALDDGALDNAEGLVMLTLAVAEGITTIVATPHFDGVDRAFPALATARLVEFRQAARDHGVEINLLLGFELQLAPLLLEWGPNLREIGLNGSRYLLVELPQGFWPPYLYEVIFRLQSLGLRLILAHAERYAAIMRDPDLAADLVRRGVFLQVNGDGLLGLHGKSVQRAAQMLTERGLVRFLASDAHSARHRPPRLRRAVDLASRLIGPSAAEQLILDNPAAVVADGDLPPIAVLRRYRRLFDFVRLGGGSRQ